MQIPENEDKEKNTPEKEIIIEKLGAEKWKLTTYIKIGTMIFLTFLACILVFFLLYRYQGLSANIGKVLKSGESIIIGLVLAYLLNPVMRFFEKNSEKILESRIRSEEKLRKMTRGIGVICSILLLLLVIGFLIAAIVPSLVSSIMSLTENLPENMQHFLRWVRKLNFGNEEITRQVRMSLTNITTYIEEWATEKVLPEAQTYITRISSGVYSVVKTIINFIIGIVVAIYVMSIKETLIGQTKKILYAAFKPNKANMIIEITREADRIFGGFIKGKILDSLIIGIICYIGCVFLQMPDPILIAAIIGVTNVIPFFGPIIGAIPCVFLVLVQNPIQALYLGIFVIILQQVDGNIIGPKILGDSTGLSSFWVMFAILLGGGNFGFLGMLLGVPVMGLIYYLMRRLANYGVRRRGLTEKTADYVELHSVDETTNQMLYMGNTVFHEESLTSDASEQSSEDQGSGQQSSENS